MTAVSGHRLQRVVAEIAREVHGRVRPDRAFPDERQLWRELCCCILSSQVPYDMAVAAADQINRAGVLFGTRGIGSQQCLERDLFEVLRVPMGVDGRIRRYRFPRARAAQIAAAWWIVYSHHGTFSALLGRYCDAVRCRIYLVQYIPGLGPKQASMFLRNVGETYDMAVIDRHVLRYMRAIGMGGDGAANISSLSAYERLESDLRRHAQSFGYPVGVFDWAIWIVMRAAAGMELP